MMCSDALHHKNCKVVAGSLFVNWFVVPVLRVQQLAHMVAFSREPGKRMHTDKTAYRATVVDHSIDVL